MTSTERTLVILKPDAIELGLADDIKQRFEDAGLKKIKEKEILPSKQLCRMHYEDIGQLITRHGEKIYCQVEEYMTRGPVIVIIYEGKDAVSKVREMIGPTKNPPKNTIRGDYEHMSFNDAISKNIALENLVHASSSVEEAKQEIKLWFGDVLGTELAL